MVVVSILIIILFIILYWLIHSGKSYSEIHAPLILEQRNKFVDRVVWFEHYFLANKGIFVIGIRHRPSILMYSAAYSFFGTIALIFAAINFYYNNYIIVCIMLLISANVFFSKTGRWFPHKDYRICFDRTVMNWKLEYPEDFTGVNPLDIPSFYDATMFYNTAISISEIYFFGEELK